MAFDRGVVCERLTTGRARRKRHKFWREKCIGAKRGRDIRGQRRNPLIQTRCYSDGILRICTGLTLFCSEMTHRNHASGRRAGIAHFRIYLYAGHIFIIDLQDACRFFETISRERESERCEQDDTARDHEQGDEVIG